MKYSRRSFIELSTKSTLAVYASGSVIASFLGCNDSPNQPFRMQSPWTNDAEFIGYFVSMANGYYKDEKLNFEYLPGGPEIVSDSVLMVKHAEIALTTPDVTINAIIKDNAPFKIIGAQYQKSPLGIVSLKHKNINSPQDLIGKTLAVPPANILTINAFLKINKIDKEKIKIVPYQYDPTPLLNGEVDATLDFITNVPFTIKEHGGEPSSFLLYDHGFQIFNDTVVVREETLNSKRDAITSWLRASKKGWEENFKNPETYPRKLADSSFKGTGRSIENEIFYNKSQKDLIETNGGIFSMSEASIEQNIKSLEAVGIKATRNMFVNNI